jgi:hypothetical protein
MAREFPVESDELPAVVVTDPDGHYQPDEIVYAEGPFLRMVTEDLVIDVPWSRVVEVRRD